METQVLVSLASMPLMKVKKDLPSAIVDCTRNMLKHCNNKFGQLFCCALCVELFVVELDFCSPWTPFLGSVSRRSEVRVLSRGH